MGQPWSPAIPPPPQVSGPGSQGPLLPCYVLVLLATLNLGLACPAVSACELACVLLGLVIPRKLVVLQAGLLRWDSQMSEL